MKLTPLAIQKIKESVQLRNLLCVALRRHNRTIDRWISENNDNLTKAVALQVIREETGLTDSEILEEQVEEESAKV